MTATAFDTLKAAKALGDAGLDDAQAQAVVAVVDDAVRAHTAPLTSGIAEIRENMATREYVTTVTDRLATRESVAAIEDKLAAVTGTMATTESVTTVTDRLATREYVTTVTDSLATRESVAVIEDKLATITETMATRECVMAAIAELRADMAVEFKTLYRHLWVMGTSIVGVTVVLVKLLP